MSSPTIHCCPRPFRWQDYPDLPHSEVFTREQAETGWMYLRLTTVPDHFPSGTTEDTTSEESARSLLHIADAMKDMVGPPEIGSPNVAKMAKRAGLKFKACDQKGNEIKAAPVDDKLAADLYCAFLTKIVPATVIARIDEFRRAFLRELPIAYEEVMKQPYLPPYDMQMKIGIVIYPKEAFADSCQLTEDPLETIFFRILGKLMKHDDTVDPGSSAADTSSPRAARPSSSHRRTGRRGKACRSKVQ